VVLYIGLPHWKAAVVTAATLTSKRGSTGVDNGSGHG
jgi:hypothetical protein